MAGVLTVRISPMTVSIWLPAPSIVTIEKPDLGRVLGGLRTELMIKLILEPALLGPFSKVPIAVTLSWFSSF